MKYFAAIFGCFCLSLILGRAPMAQGREGGAPTQDNIIVEPVAVYGDVSWENEKSHLDSLAISLSQEPNLIGYIVVYAGRRACAGEAQARGVRAKKYLVEHRGVEWNRLIWKDAGHLHEPTVFLETQLRGGKPYPYFHPKPLPLEEVRILNCKGVMSRRMRRGQS